MLAIAGGAGRPHATAATQAGGFAAAYNLDEQYRQFVLAAEDHRLRIPDWLRTPLLDQHRLRMNEDVRLLIKLAHDSKRPRAQEMAVRALGRYESREFITDLLPLVATVPEAAAAIVHAFRGPALPVDRDGEQMQRFVDTLMSIASRNDAFSSVAARALGDLPYDRPSTAASGLAHLRYLLKRAEANPDRGAVETIVRSIETFVRKSNKLAPIDDELIERLRFIATVKNPRYLTASPAATSALLLAGAIDADTLRQTASDNRYARKRYLSALALGRSATAIDEAERTAMLKRLLRDDETAVRIEAVRGWARQISKVEGCESLLEMLTDPNVNVVTVTLDLLGDICRDSERVTDYLAAHAGKSPPTLAWHRSVHAFVSLAKRAPDRVTILLRTAYPQHPTWQVRMYGARVATALKEVTVLERLAMDANDNVREAALGGLRALKGAESDPAFVSALGRDDYQLLRRAALELKGATATPELAVALLQALLRVTAEKKETSRDTRLALIERLAELGAPDQSDHLSALLRDFDITVAIAAANLLQQWTGRAQEILPVPLPRPPVPSEGELNEDVDAVIELDSGAKFGIRLDVALTPLTVTRFKRLVRANYYDGLTFHRVVPNFVIQGGSPGANEYAGDGPFMRDEIGASNSAFTVGLSTRGRDTGDAQFYINLVDNHRLDGDYTVFGRVCETPSPVDAILEGDRIRSIALTKWDPCRSN